MPALLEWHAHFLFGKVGGRDASKKIVTYFFVHIGK